MIKNKLSYIVIYDIICIILQPSISMAYIGPGAGLSAFGSFLALLAALIIAIFGFLWFPIKRFLKHLRERKSLSAE